jgi:RimJ/RimL family protein N-acetyltransferase
MAHLEYIPFNSISLDEPFFDSLKADYAEFSEWFIKKSKKGEKAYVLFGDDEALTAFVYLKIENEAHSDTNPTLPKKERVKVGTLKVEAHNTRLGERVIKKVMDFAIEQSIMEIYVTVFSKHERLVNALKAYGFEEAATKTSLNGEELVLIKVLGQDSKGIYKDYPCVFAQEKRFWVLGIWPAFHTKMFPDSILNNESYDLIADVAPTNTIRKIYIAAMNCISEMTRGDIVFIYRTKDDKGPAYYRSVVTSVCVVDETKNINDFINEEEFISYCEKSSIFSKPDLRRFYKTKKYQHIVKMTYNAAFHKRVIQKDLIEELDINPSYWGCFELNAEKAKKLAELGDVAPELIEW